MPDNLSLPFDALRPFKSKAEDFVPRDTLPWVEQAEQLLRCRTEAGFIGLRPFQQIETHVAWLVENLPLPAGAAILDIGCGPGLYSNLLGRYGYQVTGIDIAQPLLDYAQIEADALQLPCTYQCRSLLDPVVNTSLMAAFDLVLLINMVINLLTPTELAQALTNIQTALKPGGHFIGEFSLLPTDFSDAGPTTTETIELLPKSPLCDQFHALMIRHLTFPASQERVTHYLLLKPATPPREYWTRATLYPVETMIHHLAQYDLHPRQVFGLTFGQPSQDNDQICFVWAERATSPIKPIP